MSKPIAWSAKVSQTFLDRIEWLVQALLLPIPDGADFLMACIAWETGRTFSPSVVNRAGSGATGLIQNMPDTAIYFFWPEKEIATWTKEQKKQKGLEACRKLAAMSAEDQLNYVYKYFKPYKGRLHSLEDMYMAILWPAAVGKPLSYVLWDKDSRPTTYRQNSGLDLNKDGVITKEEATKKVKDVLAEGLLPKNVRQDSSNASVG